MQDKGDTETNEVSENNTSNKTLDIDKPPENSDPIDDDTQDDKEIQIKQNLDFNFVVYNEDIVITGAKGSGKSYLANTILQILHGCSVWVWDFNHQFHDSRSIVFHDLDEMLETYDEVGKRGKYILQDYNKEEKQFKRFCRAAFKRGNVVLLIDEVHSYTTKQKILKEYNDLILSGRPRGISVISISTRPASLPNNVLTNAKHVFTFRLNLESDVKWLEGYLGDEVWQVLNKNKRQKHLELPEVPPYTFYYRNMDEPQGALGKV